MQAENVGFDRLFIDANIPHHAAFVSFAAVALVRIKDRQLRAVALDIALEQAVEIGEFRSLRQQLYGESLPAPMDDGMMAAVMNLPGMAEMDPAELAFQMDPSGTAAIAKADNPDLTFIDLTIAHHQSAIAMANAAITAAASDDIKAMARHAIAAQGGRSGSCSRSARS